MSPQSVSSTPILRATLIWGSVVGGAVLIVAAAIGLLVAGAPGLGSGALGALVGIVFPALTAVSILIGNRWYGTPNYLQIFFGIVLGGWVLKLLIVIVALFLLLRLDGIVPLVFYFSLVAGAVASLVVDVVVFLRMRLPAVSDIAMPGDDETPGGNSSGITPGTAPRV